MNASSSQRGARPLRPSTRGLPRRQGVSVWLRLTALVLTIAVVLFVAVGIFVNIQLSTAFDQYGNEQLASMNKSLAEKVSIWLTLNSNAVKALAMQPDIKSMDAARQKSALVAMAATYPDVYLASTTDLKGLNVARSDAVAAKDYSGSDWFRRTVAGAPIAFQTVLGQTSNRPTLVIAVPITDTTHNVIGVAMFASELPKITAAVGASKLGQTGFSYVIDADGNVVATTDPTLHNDQVDNLKEKLDAFPQYVELQNGGSGLFRFKDKEGVEWRANLSQLDNGWDIIVQQQNNEILGATQQFRQISWFAVVVGIVLMIVLPSIGIRRVLRPVGTLTRTVEAITAGDLNRVAPIQSSDEFGLLAEAFNLMTAQLRDMLDSLETRVGIRTAQLQAGADVGRAVSSIFNTEQLLHEVVTLISERFDFYYVAVFLVDESGRWAVLHEATGEAGRLLLAQGHQLEVGGLSMVGYATGQRKSRIALDVGSDAVRFANPLLPYSRSEMVLPLAVVDRVIGALDVQSTKSAAFDASYATLLQGMADQIAVAINNAQHYQHEQVHAEQINRLLEVTLKMTEQTDRAGLETQLVQSAVSLFNADSAQLWSNIDSELELKAEHNTRPAAEHDLSRSRDLAERVFRTGLTAHVDSASSQTSPAGDASPQAAIVVPIVWQEHVTGVLSILRTHPAKPFDPDDESSAQLLATQAATALENIALAEQQQRTLDELNSVNRRLTGEAWLARISEQALTYVYRRPGISKEAQRDRLAKIPIELHGQSIGAITLEDTPDHQALTEDEQAIVQAVVQQMGLALENQRLTEAAQHAAQRDRAVAEAADHIHRPTDLDAVLRVAAEELSRITALSEIGIQLGFAPAEQPSGNDHQSAVVTKP